mmetsp:Transcript_37191/g.74338  ORF Transcript_37191/g.74338 Transcript_37191/m.74338 type:complete len:282 (-) Transcript_37191:351-1196(-)
MDTIRGFREERIGASRLNAREHAGEHSAPMLIPTCTVHHPSARLLAIACVSLLPSAQPLELCSDRLFGGLVLTSCRLRLCKLVSRLGILTQLNVRLTHAIVSLGVALGLGLESILAVLDGRLLPVHSQLDGSKVEVHRVQLFCDWQNLVELRVRHEDEVAQRLLVLRIGHQVVLPLDEDIATLPPLLRERHFRLKAQLPQLLLLFHIEQLNVIREGRAAGHTRMVDAPCGAVSALWFDYHLRSLPLVHSHEALVEGRHQDAAAEEEHDGDTALTRVLKDGA